MQGTQFIKAELEEAKLDLEIARQSVFDLLECQKLQYGRIPELDVKA